MYPGIAGAQGEEGTSAGVTGWPVRITMPSADTAITALDAHLRRFLNLDELDQM